MRSTVSRERGEATPGSWTDVAWVVIAAAYAGALGETALRLASRLAFDRPTYLNTQAAWLAPLFGLAVLIVPMAGVALLTPARRRLSAVALIGAWFAALEVLLLIPRLAPWTVVVLALGVGAVAARWTASRPRAAIRATRRLALALLGTSVIGGIGVNLPRGAERRALAATAPAAAPGRPNIILVVLDAVRAESMQLFGGPIANTPTLDRLAGECVTFERAIAPASWTLPSHASMFSGRWPASLRADWAVPFEALTPVIAERLASQGYRTAGFVGNYLYTYYEFGLNRGFAHYADYGVSASESALRNVIGDYVARGWNRLAHDYVVPGRKDASRLRRESLAWIGSSRTAPFFLFLNWYDAHDPYAPPGQWRHAFATREPSSRALADVESTQDSAAIDGLRTAYAGAIGYLDAELDSLIAGLDATGVRRGTLLVITSDHGEEFGEHGRLQHGNTLYYPSLHVPLMVCPPGDGRSGRRVQDVVSLRDLARTLQVAAGDSSTPLPGHDLSPWLSERGSTACRSKGMASVRRTPGASTWYEGADDEITSLVEGRYHLIRTDRGREELFDVSADPFEQRDLAGVPAMDSVKVRLRGSLADPDGCARD